MWCAGHIFDFLVCKVSMKVVYFNAFYNNGSRGRIAVRRFRGVIGRKLKKCVENLVKWGEISHEIVPLRKSFVDSPVKLSIHLGGTKPR